MIGYERTNTLRWARNEAETHNTFTIKTIGIIVGPNKEQVIDTVKSVNWAADIEFIYQDAPRGLAHAVKISEEYLGDDKCSTVIEIGIFDPPAICAVMTL